MKEPDTDQRRTYTFWLRPSVRERMREHMEKSERQQSRWLERVINEAIDKETTGEPK